VADQAGSWFDRRTVLVCGALLAAALPFAALLLLVVSSWSPLQRLDRAVSASLHGYAVDHPAFTTGMRLVTDTGSSLVWIVVLVPVFGWLVYRRRPRLAAFVAVTALGSAGLNNVIKLLVGRARPRFDDPVATAIGKSFPSGHTQATVVGYGIVLLVFFPVIPRAVRPQVVLLAAAMVALVGFSRIALGVHYLSDVIGAVLIGVAWLLAMTAAFAAWPRGPGEPPMEASAGPGSEDGGRPG
jgi:membrane-associated phospholipid phosphatase